MNKFTIGLVRVLSTMELPIVYMILSIQSSETMWKLVWFGIAIYKFATNLISDYILMKQNDARLEMIKSIKRMTKEEFNNNNNN